ncbi:CD320 antigen isoform X1 [Alligator mississippiensis]|uniref:CD320 antigen isoform X1 n=1 Tax=Alligator mississippiensis TaxID=8496 RepID=UPI0028780995|nr:CD320 antigen isoform X1 [Alligator mississippiensis]
MRTSPGRLGHRGSPTASRRMRTPLRTSRARRARASRGPAPQSSAPARTTARSSRRLLHRGRGQMAGRRLLLLLLAGLLVPARLQTPEQGPAPCPEHEFRCAPGDYCFPRTFLCDGHDDCEHGEDEQDCAAPTAEAPPCGAGEFHCVQGGCVPLQQTCDGERDCTDGSDESTCSTPGLPCGPHLWQCRTSRLCLPRGHLCDGRWDCPNGTDESAEACQLHEALSSAVPSTASTEAPPCGAGEFRCVQGGCVPLQQTCDGERDCTDGSDESTCSTSGLPCGPHLWQCRTSRLCLPRGHLCNGRRDCPDGTDESAEACQLHEALSSAGPSTASTEAPLCSAGEFRCVEGGCVPLQQMCDGERDCTDGSDESTCSTPGLPCGPHLWQCRTSRLCLPRGHLCDGRRDCPDGTDESAEACQLHEALSSTVPSTASTEAPPCGADEFRCLQGGCVPLQQTCDGERNCADGSDESTCSSTPGLPCGPHLWQCRTASLCLPRGHLCNGHRDCPDGTDESAEACQLHEALSSVGPSTASTETPSETPGSLLHQAPLWVIATIVLLSVLVGIGCITAWRRSRKKSSFTSISLEKTSKEQLMPARRPSTTFP